MRPKTRRYTRFQDWFLAFQSKTSLPVLAAFLCSGFAGLAQSDDVREIGIQSVRKGIVYKTEWSFDVALHTNGFYLGYNRGKIPNYHTTKTTHLDIGILYHPLETSTSRPSNVGFRTYDAYKFGKKNHVLNFRFGKGYIKTFTEKARKKGVALGLQLQGGLLIGLQKPYYLKIKDERDGQFFVREIRYDDDPEAFMDADNILGRSSFFKGFDHLSIVPGLYGRVALRIDPGAFERLVRCLELGLQLDFYTKRPQLLVIDDNPYHYLNFFINLQLGSRKAIAGN